MTAHAAYLRVYEPLAAFTEPERSQWQAYLDAATAPLPAAGGELERAASLRALARRSAQVLPELAEHAYVTDVDGVTLLCPWRTHGRSLEALEEFLADLPEELVEAFLPGGDTDAVTGELQAYRAEHPEQRRHQLTSTWQVPLRWFLLVEATEREVQLGGRVGGGAALPGRRTEGPCTDRSLVYRTAMSRARRRTARALALLRRTMQDGAVAAGVEDLGRWLEEFHPRSLVELDYGGLVHLLDDAELSQDESARDIAAAMAALDAGDGARAAAAYARVTARMKALQAVESAN